MQKASFHPPKPVSEHIRPEITRLPELTVARRLCRRIFLWLLRLLVRLCARCTVKGLGNVPRTGAALLVSNHLGDADLLVGLAFTPRPVEVLSKAELHDFPVLGKLMDWYGVIWVHRGQPDRRALKAALEGLNQGRLLAIAPEGRESLTGALEEGTGGAAYLAYKSGAPIVPVAFTGTENRRVFTNLKRLRRTQISLTIGEPFYLDATQNRREAIHSGTQQIMRRLARLLPAEYRGVYSEAETEVESPVVGSREHGG